MINISLDLSNKLPAEQVNIIRQVMRAAESRRLRLFIMLLLKSDELSLLVRLLPTIGGTKRRAWTQIIETPNQPVGDSMQIPSLFGRFFEEDPVTGAAGNSRPIRR